MKGSSALCDCEVERSDKDGMKGIVRKGGCKVPTFFSSHLSVDIRIVLRKNCHLIICLLVQAASHFFYSVLSVFQRGAQLCYDEGNIPIYIPWTFQIALGFRKNI